MNADRVQYERSSSSLITIVVMTLWCFCEIELFFLYCVHNSPSVRPIVFGTRLVKQGPGNCGRRIGIVNSETHCALLGVGAEWRMGYEPENSDAILMRGDKRC